MTKVDLYPFPKSARFWLLSLVKKSFGLYWPGPGAYEPTTSVIKDKVPTFSIKGDKRDSSLIRTIDNPGPGSYAKDIHNEFGKNAKTFTIG